MLRSEGLYGSATGTSPLSPHSTAFLLVRRLSLLVTQRFTFQSLPCQDDIEFLQSLVQVLLTRPHFIQWPGQHRDQSVLKNFVPQKRGRAFVKHLFHLFCFGQKFARIYPREDKCRMRGRRGNKMLEVHSNN